MLHLIILHSFNDVKMCCLACLRHLVVIYKKAYWLTASQWREKQNWRAEGMREEEKERKEKEMPGAS